MGLESGLDILYRDARRANWKSAYILKEDIIIYVYF